MKTKEKNEYKEILRQVIDDELVRVLSPVVQAIADIKRIVTSLSDNKLHHP